jgi:hypothetical protein
MKRILAVAVLAGASLWLGGGPAHASTTASIKVSPGWTYNDGGKLAVTARCPASGDLRVISSRMLSAPVDMRKGGNLLIEVTDKTNSGRYGIELVCEASGGRPVAFAEKWVKVLRPLSGWHMRPAPALPAHFKPNVTVQTGPARMG